MFIATANLLDPIPPALRDRMEVLQLPGYTEEEKLQIARQFLIPKQLDANGLTTTDDRRPTTDDRRPMADDRPPAISRTKNKEQRTKNGASKGNGHLVSASAAADTQPPRGYPARDTQYELRFGETTLRQLIRAYTYEAGVRNLEREIGAICRKVARRVAEGRPAPRMINAALLGKYLGPPRHAHNSAEQRDEVGVATGMFWTANGGDTLTVEVSIMEGKGNLIMTGQLGDVMRESAQAALSFARANAGRLGIEGRRFEASDIHIHVPEGAVPKDGPSAGITLATALISALTGRAIRRDVAMTGEITLRGRVLPVGGVKEKVLGAHRAGIRTIILPAKNERDIAEVPSQVKRRLAFVYVEQVDQVFANAFCEE
jgi:ATP-dependent Lon protease